MAQALVGGRVPECAVEAGEDEHRKPYYICGTNHQGSQQVGRTSDGDPSCHFGYGGRAMTAHAYSVLVQLTLPRRN